MSTDCRLRGNSLRLAPRWAAPRQRRRCFAGLLLVLLLPAAAVGLSDSGEVEKSHDGPLTFLPGFDWRLLFEGATPDLVFSKVLSLCVIAGSFIGKMPQVLAIWRAKSADGLSKVSMWTEVINMGVQFAYNVVRRSPLTTYAEVAILFPQLLLVVLVAAYVDGYLKVSVWLAALTLCLGTVGMALGIVPPVVTAALYAVNAITGFVSVLPQVSINYQQRSTGQLSFLVTAMTFAGISTRLFTTFVEVDDVALQLTMALNWSLIAVLMMQFFLYRDKRLLPPMSPSRRVDKSFAVTPPPLRPKLKKMGSIVDIVSSLGSHRCLLELVDDEAVSEHITKLRSSGSMHFERISRSFGSMQSLQRFASSSELPLPASSPTSQELLRPASPATSPGLRRN